MKSLIEQIEALVGDGLKISSVYLEPQAGGKYIAVVGISNWLPLGEGGNYLTTQSLWIAKTCPLEFQSSVEKNTKTNESRLGR